MITVDNWLYFGLNHGKRGKTRSVSRSLLSDLFTYRLVLSPVSRRESKLICSTGPDALRRSTSDGDGGTHAKSNLRDFDLKQAIFLLEGPFSRVETKQAYQSIDRSMLYEHSEVRIDSSSIALVMGELPLIILCILVLNQIHLITE